MTVPAGARHRLDPHAERAAVEALLFDSDGRWNGLEGAVQDGAVVVFCVPDPPAPHTFLDLNCLCDRADPPSGHLDRRTVTDPDGRTRELAIGAVRLPAGWRGTYRILDLPAPPEELDAAGWRSARTSGRVPLGDRGRLWPEAPFAPAVEVVAPDAADHRWVDAGAEVPARSVGEVEPVDAPELDGTVGVDGLEASRVRIPGGRGTLLLLDGLTFLAFGAHRGLAALPQPPATVLALGRAGAGGRRELYSADPARRDAVLDWARAETGEPPVVAGASLGGAFALYCAAGNPNGATDGVAGAVSLSGSYWMRDATGAPVWAGLGPDSPSVHLAWGTSEVKLAAVTAEAVEEVRRSGVRYSTSTRVGGHDFAWWRDEVGEGYRLIAEAIGEQRGER